MEERAVRSSETLALHAYLNPNDRRLVTGRLDQGPWSDRRISCLTGPERV